MATITSSRQANGSELKDAQLGTFETECGRFSINPPGTSTLSYNYGQTPTYKNLSSEAAFSKIKQTLNFENKYCETLKSNAKPHFYNNFNYFLLP